jgi:undecaprenyl diphosphate synthase
MTSNPDTPDTSVTPDEPTTMEPASPPPLDLPPQALPRHIAIIMDGNGRWAKRQNQPRSFGHAAGALAARQIILECARLGLQALTLYSFSTENWKRPAEEVDFLMELGRRHLEAERRTVHESNIRFKAVGNPHGIPPSLLDALREMERLTAGNTGMTLCLALNYGSRDEIVQAVRRLVAEGASPQQVTEQAIADRLWTAGVPDPDLLIRTAGEMRLSNFLLWQISYAELYVTDLCWPDFGIAALHEAIREFARRTRRFGAVV